MTGKKGDIIRCWTCGKPYAQLLKDVTEDETAKAEHVKNLQSDEPFVNGQKCTCLICGGPAIAIM